MGLDGACFNPHHSYEIKRVVECVTPAVTDMTMVDYLVHPGKNTMTQIYDAALGDLPYHLDVKVLTDKEIKKNKDITYTSHPTFKVEFSLIHFSPELLSPVIFKQDEKTTYRVIFEAPEPMIEALPFEIKMVTSQVITEIEEFQGEAYVYPKANSPFFGLKGMDLINAKLDFIGADKWDKEEEEEGEDWKPYIDAEDYTTDPCRPQGRLTDEQFKDLWIDTEEAFYIPLSLQEEEEIPEFDDPEEIPDEEVHYRAGHWLGGDIVESLEPVKKVARRVIHMAKATFLSRTRIQSRRGGYLTMIQWDALFGGDAPEAVKTATPGVHPLAPLLGLKRVSAKVVAGLRLAGYRVEDVIPEGYRRRVTCLIVP